MIRILKIALCILSFGFTASLLAEQSVFENNGFSKKIQNLVKPEIEKATQLHIYDSSYKAIPAKAVILHVAPKSGYSLLNKIRNKLKNTGSQAYLYEQYFGYKPDEIVLINTRDDLEYLKIVRTSAPNYDLVAEDVLKKYIQWDEQYQLSLIGAGPDWLVAEVQSDDVDWKVFSKEVFEFCPDVVWQGTNTLEELENEMRKSKTLYLWWD